MVILLLFHLLTNPIIYLISLIPLLVNKMQTVDLDIRTLSFIATNVAFLFALGLFAFGRPQKEFKGFSLFATGLALFAAGLFLLGYRDVLPDFITIILANCAIIAGLIFLYEGISRFLGHSTRFHLISILAIVIGIVLFVYFTYASPSINYRILSFTAIHMVISALCAVELTRKIHKSWRVPAMATGIIFALYSLFQLVRFLWTLGENPILSFMSAGNVHASSFIAIIILICGSTFGMVWMVNRQLIHHLTELATHDPLTNVLNRRGLELLAEHEFAKMKRGMADLSALMMDIDYFKQMNDLYGHTAGDLILQDFADQIQKNLRAADVFGRTGGDEFFILLPGTTLDQADNLAERFRKMIEEHEFNFDNQTIHLTTSIGVSNAFPEYISLDQLMLFTDRALLQAKQNGRNQVASMVFEIDKTAS
jgi:diguanylate cyclase (GGDEF)-like protein